MAGAFQGIRAGLSQQERSFRVTPKGARGLKPLPARMVVPSLIVGAIPAWVAVATAKPGIAAGLFFLAALQALTYLVAVFAAIWIHAWNNAHVHLDGGVSVVQRVRLIAGDTVLLTAAFALVTIGALTARLA